MDIEPNVEYKNKIDNNKTALHVASIKGFDKKLRILLNCLNRKYEFGFAKSGSNINITMVWEDMG